MPKRPGRPYTVRLTYRELSTVLAALRYYEENTSQEDRADSEYFTDCRPMNDDQIDELCIRINTDA